jgi:diphthine synthase
MLYIIGLGLNVKGISLEGLEAAKKCNKVYLESYTVDFPYEIKKLEKIINKKIIILNREEVEGDFLIKESKKEDISLLVYGSPLFATTHMSLINEAKKQKINVKIIYSASVFDAIAQTGLQLYKFGKITSIPKWKNNYEPCSFIDIIKENISIKAHSLVLVDIGLYFKDSLIQLEKACKNKNLVMDKILVCSNLGSEKIYIVYGEIKNLKKNKINPPFCFIIPSEMHFFEKEEVDKFNNY